MIQHAALMRAGCMHAFICLTVLFLTAKAYGIDKRTCHVRLIPQKLQQGDVALLRVTSTLPLSSVQGQWGKTPLYFYPGEKEQTFETMLGVDLAETPGKKSLVLTITYPEKSSALMPFTFTVLKKDFPTQKLTLPPETVTLSQKNLARVNKEMAIINDLWASGVKEKRWTKNFIKPVDGTIISSFGLKRILNNEPRSPHTGIDLRSKQGTPVLASSDGIVAYTGDLFFSGKSVFLDHGMGIFTMYFHLSAINVKKGGKVSQGQVIGRVGSTGRATGPHLHWGVRIYDKRVDPLTLLTLFQKQGL